MAIESGGGFGSLWRAVAGCGGLWRAMAACGGLWRASRGPNKKLSLWRSSRGEGVWRLVAACGGLWRPSGSLSTEYESLPPPPLKDIDEFYMELKSSVMFLHEIDDLS